MLGKIYTDQRNWRAAEDQLEAAIFLDQKRPEAHLEFGRVLLAQSRHQQALKHLEEARAGSLEDAQFYELLSQAYAGLGRAQQAAAAGQRARELSKNKGAASGASNQN